MPRGISMINGVAYSSSDVQVVIFGRSIVGITKLDYKAKQEKTNNKAFQTEPVSRGYGPKDYEFGMEIYKEEFAAMMDAAPNKDVTQIPPFEIQVIYGGDNPSVTLREDHISFCEFIEDPMSVSAGDTSIKLSIPLIIGGITHL